MYLARRTRQGGHRCISSGEPDREETGVSRQENQTGRTQVYLVRRTRQEGHRCISPGEQDREDTGASGQENQTGRTQVYLTRRTGQGGHKCISPGEQDREDTGVSSPEGTKCISIGVLDVGQGVSHRIVRIGRTQVYLCLGELQTGMTQVYLVRRTRQGGHKCISPGEQDREDTGVSSPEGTKSDKFYRSIIYNCKYKLYLF